MKTAPFSGVATALVTPFTEDSSRVDLDAFDVLVDYQLRNSADALVVSGTTGESPVLSRDEKIMLFRRASEAANGKIPVIAGTGSNNTQEAVRKSNDAEKEGVNGLLIVTPYYNKCTQDGLIKHYFYIADRVSTPIIVYNVPSRTGVTINPETYKALSEHKNIVAVKDASADISQFIKASALCKDRLTFYSGNDDQTVTMMSYGAAGVISVASNIIPEIMHKITKLCAESRYEEAAVLHREYLELMNILFCEVNPIPIKYCCSQLLGIRPELRLPLTAISKNNSLKIREMLMKYKLL